MSLQHNVKAVIRRGDDYYVAECLEIAVVTQGKTLDETFSNLQEAVALFLEGEDPTEFGLTPNQNLYLTVPTAGVRKLSSPLRWGRAREGFISVLVLIGA